MMRHRNDIDGLRAFAIVPVVLYHYGLTQIAPGGFVGVDIFFVISGFLITKNLHDTINDGSYRILDFYNRRIRRIFPALFVMFLACTVFSLLIEFPDEAKNTNDAVLASVFFVSNILFYHTSGYFDLALQSNPLLHTWSLSVEEQFYVVVPVFLFLIRKLQPRLKIALVYGALTASFLLSSYMVFHDKSAAFYLVQNRAWELLTGSVLAINGVPRISKPKMLEFCGLAGLALILGSILLTNKNTLFPGPGALAPCLGAALILYSGASRETMTARLLSVQPFRFIGLISYSLYLWHWPVFVYYSLLYGPHGIARFGFMAIAVGLAAASWRFVEQPFRTKPFRLNARATVGAGAAIMAGMSLLALAAIPLNPAIWNYPPQTTKILSYMNDPGASMRPGTCFLFSGANGFKFFNAPTCLNTDPTRKNYLLIGDSHAADIWSGLAKDNPSVNFLQATASGCKPILGTTGEKRCTDLRQFIFKDFIPRHHLDGIILSANWDDDEIAGAIKTAQSLRPYATHVIIFGPSALYDQALPRLLARSLLAKNPAIISRHLVAEQKITDADFAHATLGPGLAYVSIYTAMCPARHCIAEVGNDIPLQSDAEHFTQAGAALIAARINFDPLATFVAAK
jgi:peptidoglycan/LPS O-acetylase OafA/YrhL